MAVLLSPSCARARLRRWSSLGWSPPRRPPLRQEPPLRDGLGFASGLTLWVLALIAGGMWLLSS